MTTERNLETVEGAINRIELSGRLMYDVTQSQFPSGASCLKCILVCPKPGKKSGSDMNVHVTMWVNSDNGAAVEQALTFKQGDAVVVIGKLVVNYANGRHYIDITADAIG